jgi:hypothetical protein
MVAGDGAFRTTLTSPWKQERIAAILRLLRTEICRPAYSMVRRTREMDHTKRHIDELVVGSLRVSELRVTDTLQTPSTPRTEQ